MNVIKRLEPWRSEGGIWAFDDPTCGLRGEPFVTNASKLIDELVKFFGVKPDSKGQIQLMFSHVPFPDSVRMVLVNDSQGGGVTYYCEQFEQAAWLCPAFYNYFDTDRVPVELYAMAA